MAAAPQNSLQQLAVSCLLLLVSTPFLASGALPYVSMADRAPWPRLAATTAVAAVLGGIGFAILLKAVARLRRPAKTHETSAPSDRPWLTRQDWADGRVLPNDEASVAKSLVGLTYWIAVTLPLMLELPEILLNADSVWKWTTLAFPLVGVSSVVGLAYSVVRDAKFAGSVLELTPSPGAVGGELRGVVRIPRDVKPEKGFRVNLICREDRDSDEREGEGAFVAWQDEQLVLNPLRSESPGETLVPVRFSIPRSAPETSRPGSQQSAQWRLEVSAQLPGVNYYSVFDVPVFKLAKGVARNQLDVRPLPDGVREVHPEWILRDAGIVKESLPDGVVRLTFTARRRWGMAVAGTVVLAVVAGAVVLMLQFDAPILVPLAASVVALLIAWKLLDLWLYRSVVDASPAGVTFWGGLLGRGAKRFLPFDQIDDFDSYESASSNNRVSIDLGVSTRSGEEFTIAKGVSSILIEQAVLDELRHAVGR